MQMMDSFFRESVKKARHRIWVVSDLQQKDPDRARTCMTKAMEDFLSLDCAVEAVCYLGDGAEGSNPDHIREMARMQVEEMRKVQAPVYYVLGNHDFDFFHAQGGRLALPFLETVRGSWYVPDVTALGYTVDLGELRLCLLTDHGDPEGKWHTHHGKIDGDRNSYPYDEKDYRAFVEAVGTDKPVISMAHYAFPGGNRAADLYRWFMPLPDSFRMHLYGHAHIGDRNWAGVDAFRKYACVDDARILQMDVASLETGRGCVIRSVILLYMEDGEIGLFSRNHSLRNWDTCLFQSRDDGKYVPLEGERL